MIAAPYDRAGVRVGIVHLGVGGFHRSHQAMYLDRLLAEGQAREWGICGVGLLPGDAAMAAALGGQDGLYTLVEKHPDGRLEDRVIGSIVRYLWAPADQAAVLEVMTDPAVRIVSLTITEGGYVIDDLDPNLTGPPRPRSAFAYLAEALQRRRAAGTAPFTVLSCDNVRNNGDVARAALVGTARLVDPELAEWIEHAVAFPNSMVDRITPATTDADRAALTGRVGHEDAWPVVCEPYVQWVLEDRFPAGRPSFERAGVELVADVEPYELMKLRLLNASHQVLCYLAALRGHEYVHDAMADATVATAVRRYLLSEAAPTLTPIPGVDFGAYAASLSERFGNPHVRDTVARLCAFGSDRLPTFLVPVLHANLARGGPIAQAVLAIAAWRQWLAQAGDVVDNRAGRIVAAARSADPLDFVTEPELFGDLAASTRFADAFVRATATLPGLVSRT